VDMGPSASVKDRSDLNVGGGSRRTIATCHLRKVSTGVEIRGGPVLTAIDVGGRL